jgi:hypothetical protein
LMKEASVLRLRAVQGQQLVQSLFAKVVAATAVVPELSQGESSLKGIFSLGSTPSVGPSVMRSRRRRCQQTHWREISNSA